MEERLNFIAKIITNIFDRHKLDYDVDYNMEPEVSGVLVNISIVFTEEQFPYAKGFAAIDLLEDHSLFILSVFELNTDVTAIGYETSELLNPDEWKEQDPTNKIVGFLNEFIVDIKELDPKYREIFARRDKIEKICDRIGLNPELFLKPL